MSVITLAHDTLNGPQRQPTKTNYWNLKVDILSSACAVEINCTYSWKRGVLAPTCMTLERIPTIVRSVYPIFDLIRTEICGEMYDFVLLE